MTIAMNLYQISILYFFAFTLPNQSVNWYPYVDEVNVYLNEKLIYNEKYGIPYKGGCMMKIGKGSIPIDSEEDLKGELRIEAKTSEQVWEMSAKISNFNQEIKGKSSNNITYEFCFPQDFLKIGDEVQITLKGTDVTGFKILGIQESWLYKYGCIHIPNDYKELIFPESGEDKVHKFKITKK